MVNRSKIIQFRPGRVVRVAADVSMALGSIESNYEKMITLTKCDAPITKILVDQKHKILLVITEENTLIEYKLSHGDNGRTITEVLVVSLAFYHILFIKTSCAWFYKYSSSCLRK